MAHLFDVQLQYSSSKLESTWAAEDDLDLRSHNPSAKQSLFENNSQVLFPIKPSEADTMFLKDVTAMIIFYVFIHLRFL